MDSSSEKPDIDWGQMSNEILKLTSAMEGYVISNGGSINSKVRRDHLWATENNSPYIRFTLNGAEPLSNDLNIMFNGGESASKMSVSRFDDALSLFFDKFKCHVKSIGFGGTLYWRNKPKHKIFICRPDEFLGTTNEECDKEYWNEYSIFARFYYGD